MAIFLDLPRELYLMVCSLLTTADLIHLASTSRDHYRAVQQPLYSHVRISSYPALVNLVDALSTPPIISHVEEGECRRDDKLVDDPLWEREIKTLDLRVHVWKDGELASAPQLSRCIGWIAGQCSQVKISLTLVEVLDWLMNAGLKGLVFPNVTNLSIVSSPRIQQQVNSPRYTMSISGLWMQALSGSTFPSLQRISLGHAWRTKYDIPPNIRAQCEVARGFRPRRFLAPSGDVAERTPSDYGRLQPQELKIELSLVMNVTFLEGLLASRIIPGRLTRLEIVNCPRVHPILDMGAIADLLRAALPSLQTFKLHLTPYFDGFEGFPIAYKNKLDAHPEYHYCDIIRELGRTIPHLDLLLPFACSRALQTAEHAMNSAAERSMHPPSLSREPLNTLPQRLKAEGYRYRRLTFTHFCSDVERWDQMAALGERQDEKVSWELIYDADVVEKEQAAWFVSDRAPVHFGVRSVMDRKFEVDRSFSSWEPVLRS
ncbi:hypothetical protein BDY17DRAFT_174168 [Neohortaea acidophila]|uniref:F-box domain-containing protein n=1 Tax=Neohortaea acidophila TaxID=245834 RepID=A0A6A6PPI9_9PEZI|nr:uncharacterized protein BDY17DRAFT_174168 [Neohortaea acidophila]KAF2481932.1 hypothetical protein BDY17DRAFT_174168 [Neohortaea acidophila]